MVTARAALFIFLTCDQPVLFFAVLFFAVLLFAALCAPVLPTKAILYVCKATCARHTTSEFFLLFYFFLL